MIDLKNTKTLIEIADAVGKNYQNPKAFNFLENGKWVHISSQEFSDKIKLIALALKEIGLNKNDVLGILSYPNSIWLIMDFAAITAGGVSVPIFFDIAPQNLLFEINDAAVKFIFCDNAKTLALIKKSGLKFKKIIIYGFDEKGENIINFSDLLVIGKKINDADPKNYLNLIKNIHEDDLAAIIYTSGSTGVPKGVEITHKNLVSQIKGAAQFFPLDHKQDIALSFLPLAHIFERMVVSYYITSGISIYFVDDIKNLGNIIKEIRPSLMTVVPRMLEKVYKKMHDDVSKNNFIKKIIGLTAFKLALKQDPDQNIFGVKILLKIFDLLVYKKLRAALGGRFRMMICGGAPLSLEMEKFFRNISINLFVGYGTTESSPVIAANHANSIRTGTVGKAFPEVQVKLEKDGELLAKGPNIMKRYHNNLQKTKEVIDADGWLHTGDLAMIDQDNFIKITGRKKELYKTSGGKYISPIAIEQKLLSHCELLSAAAVIADGKKFPSCLLFPDFEILEKYKNKIGMNNLSDEDFLNSDFVTKKISNLIDQINLDLNHWEQIKKYYLVKDPISIATGELTPSMKLRREVVEGKYKNVIDGFYEEQ